MSVVLISLEEVVADPNCVMISHYHYKEGRFGRVFYFHDGEWKPSSMPVEKVRLAIKKMFNPVVLIAREHADVVPIKAAKKAKKVPKPRKRYLKEIALDKLRESEISLTRHEWAAKCDVPAPSLSPVVRALAKERLILRAATKRVPGAFKPVETWRANRKKERAA